MTDTPIIKIDPDAQNALGRTLRGKFEKWSSERREIEQQWIKSLRQVNGVYDPEVLNQFGPQQSRAYPRITRVKVASMVARLTSLLFPAGEKNWSLEASPVPTLPPNQMLRALNLWAQQNPQGVLTDDQLDKIIAKFAAAAAAKLEQQVDDQLGDIAAYGPGDYEALVRRVVRSAVMYGPGVLKGPMTLATTRTVGSVVNGQPNVEEKAAYRPYFEFVPCWDYYPDLAAKSFAQMDGQFHRHIMSRHQLRLLADRQDFKGDVIRSYLQRRAEGNYQRRPFETELSINSKQSVVAVNNRKYELLEWWGFVSGHELRAAGVPVPDEKLDTDIRATVWIIDDEVIKAALDPFPDGTNMYHVFVFEEDDLNLLGTGIPAIMRDSQLAVASAARMLMDNASVVCGPNVEVDTDRLAPGQDTSIKPFKVWYAEGGSTATGAPLVRNVSFDGHIPELLNIISTFTEFADKETFINPATGGEFDGSGEALRTTGNMSMILGNAALPFRDVVRNFDRFTVSVIDAMVKWNSLFNDREDIIGDIRPVGRGATTLVAKEVRAAAMDQLAQTLLDEERDYVDFGELVKQRLLARDLPTDKLLVSDDEAQQRQQAKADQAQQQAQQQSQLIEAQIKEIIAGAMKSAAQAQKNLDSAEAANFKAVTDAIAKGVDPHVASALAQRTAPASVPSPQRAGDPNPAAVAGAGAGAPADGVPQDAGFH